MKIINRTQGTVLGWRVSLADTWWSRFRGFLGKAAPGRGEGILLAPCNAVHTMGMRFPLDVIFLTVDGTVVQLESFLRPWRIRRGARAARYVLEVPAGTISATRTTLGDELSWALEARPSLQADAAGVPGGMSVTQGLRAEGSGS